MNLYEGNIGEMWGADNYFGGTSYGTALRNYLTGFNPNYAVSSEAVWLDRLAYDYNLVGNVLGSTLQAPIAYTGCTMYTGAQPGIYRLGYPNLGNCDTTPWDNFTPPGGYPDPKVTSTQLRWGNYDYFNRATRFASSEIPSGVPVPSDNVIPNSYYYSGRPAWWKAGIAWPPIGPDVTGGNGDTSGHVNKIPAQVCWETSNLNGGGAFSASNCYVATAIPSITSSLSANGTVGTPFTFMIAATNNPASFNATGLPAGLGVNTATGVISGTPTAAGTSSIGLSATNAAGTGTATLTLTVNAANTPVITSSLRANGVVGSPFSYTITATNSPTSFTAAVLPPGLSVNTTTGVISGTPTAAGMSSITLRASNAGGTGSATLALTINVAAAPPSITSALTASGTAGSPFRYTITATNNPTSFNAAGLPAGLSVNTTTGVISGKPTAAGTSSVTVSATDARGTGSATLTLTINQRSTVLLGSQVVQSTVDTDALGSAEAFQTIARASGTVGVLSIYLDASSTVTTLVAGLYADSAGHPGALISQGTSSQLTAGAWNNIRIPAAVVSAGTTYWLAILGTENGTLSFRDGSSGCTSENSLQTGLTALPSTWSSGAVYSSCPLSGYGRT